MDVIKTKSFWRVIAIVCVYGCIVYYHQNKRIEESKKIKYSQMLTFQYGWLKGRLADRVDTNKEWKKDSLQFIKTMYE